MLNSIWIYIIWTKYNQEDVECHSAYRLTPLAIIVILEFLKFYSKQVRYLEV